MIRSFPYGFKYPIPRGWPCAEEGEGEPDAPDWFGEDNQETIREQWRGFRIAVRLLAQDEVQHRVSEMVLDAHLLMTGLTCHIFDQVCDEYNNFSTILRRPNFRRLDLSLLVGRLDQEEWVSYRKGLLRKALAGAEDLEHVHLHTDLDLSVNTGITNSDGTHQNEVLLQTIFPIEKWPRLQHFGLSGFIVNQDNLISLLSQLPNTLRSVELSFLRFLDGKGNYQSLLYDLRDKLDWRNRALGNQPLVVIGIHEDNHCVRAGKAIWVNKEARAFIYGEGRNPFGSKDGSSLNMVFPGAGGIERDEFEPAYERPNVSTRELVKLGIEQ